MHLAGQALPRVLPEGYLQQNTGEEFQEHLRCTWAIVAVLSLKSSPLQLSS